MKKTGLLIAFLFIVQISFAQVAMSVEATGKGNPIMFLPGFTSPGSVWGETVVKLVEPFQRHIVSYAGFNGMQPISTPWYATIKKQLIEYIEAKNLSQLTLIGHSMGGNLAIELAADLPDRVSGLIFVESIPCMRELMMPGVTADNIQHDSPYSNQILAMSDDDFKKMAVQSAQYMTNVESKVEMLSKWSIASDRKTYVYGYTDLLKLDLRDRLLKITTPTLILGASFPDREVVKSNYEKQYANLKNKQFLIAENSKHFIMFDQPEWLYTQINKYLKQNGK